MELSPEVLKQWDLCLSEVFTKTLLYTGGESADLALSFICGVDYALTQMDPKRTSYFDGYWEWVNLQKKQCNSVVSWIRVIEGATTEQEKLKMLYDSIKSFRREVEEKGLETLKREHNAYFGHD